jgi:TonB family protein
MITGIVSFLFLVSMAAAGAAWLLEAGAHRLGSPTRRWGWLAALWAGPSLLAAGALRSLPIHWSRAPGAVSGEARFLEVIPLEPFQVAITGSGPTLEWGLLALWIACSGLAGVVVVRSQLQLLRNRTAFQESRVEEHSVLLSVDRGPAVMGILAPRIILPRWTLGLPRNQLALVLAHEQEHVRARDPGVVALALLGTLVTAWNPVTWWTLARLRSAMELDCDDRVLALHPNPSAYGRSLLAVAARHSRAPIPLTAFAERPGTLKRRIQSMTQSHTGLSRAAGSVFILGGMVLAILSCDVPNPMAGPEEDLAAPAADAVAPASEEVGNPLIVVDGVITDRAVEELEGLDIASVEVVKGEKATSIYGERSKNGVILIRTKESEEAQDVTPTFTPFTARPEILNRQDVAEALEREYPPLLREAGVGGTVVVWLFIDEGGTVQEVRTASSSGHDALDQAALRVGESFEFSSAMNKDEPVPVWIQLPITFAVR